MRGRSSTDSEGRGGGGGGKSSSAASCSLSRSRSAQSLKLQQQDQASQDDKMNILVQLFWICMAILESDYEHEFLLGLRLLERVLSRLPLDRPDVREKLEKLQVSTKERMCEDYPSSRRLLSLRPRLSLSQHTVSSFYRLLAVSAKVALLPRSALSHTQGMHQPFHPRGDHPGEGEIKSKNNSYRTGTR